MMIRFWIWRHSENWRRSSFTVNN